MLQPKVRIGHLDREVTFVQAIIEQGTSNENKIIGWEEIDSYSSVSARKIENGGGVLAQSDRITWSQTVTWVIRWRDDLNVRMRLIWDTKVYEILNISDLDEGRQRYLNITTNLLDNEYFT